jgi:hypothetical protein
MNGEFHSTSALFVASAAAVILARWMTVNSPESAVQSWPGDAPQFGHPKEIGLTGRTGGMMPSTILIRRSVLQRFIVVQFTGLGENTAKESG